MLRQSFEGLSRNQKIATCYFGSYKELTRNVMLKCLQVKQHASKFHRCVERLECQTKGSSELFRCQKRSSELVLTVMIIIIIIEFFYRVKVSVLYKYIRVKKLLSTLFLRKALQQKWGKKYFKKKIIIIIRGNVKKRKKRKIKRTSQGNI